MYQSVEGSNDDVFPPDLRAITDVFFDSALRLWENGKIKSVIREQSLGSRARIGRWNENSATATTAAANTALLLFCLPMNGWSRWRSIGSGVEWKSSDIHSSAPAQPPSRRQGVQQLNDKANTPEPHRPCFAPRERRTGCNLQSIFAAGNNPQTEGG